MTTNKALFIEEENYYLVRLTPGVYMIDGYLTTIDNSNKEIAVYDINDIILLEYEQKIIHYVNVDGEELSIKKYDEKIQELTKNAVFDDFWRFKEEEYEFKKFKRDWIPFTKKILTKQTDVPIEVERIQIKTDNEFIVPVYFSDGEFSSIYKYNRANALMSKFKELVKTLNLVESEKLNLVESEKKNTNTYYLPTHSFLKFARICGEYIFNDNYDTHAVKTISGTLDELKVKYEKDMKDITTRVFAAYNLANDRNLNLNYKQVLNKFLIIKDFVNKIDSKVATLNYYKLAQEHILNLEKSLIESAANIDSDEIENKRVPTQENVEN